MCGTVIEFERVGEWACAHIKDCDCADPDYVRKYRCRNVGYLYNEPIRTLDYPEYNFESFNAFKEFVRDNFK